MEVNMSYRNIGTPVNSTMITMHERFSSLPQQVPQAGPSRTAIASVSIKPASARNRQLADQLERKLSNQVALRLKKKSIRQRLGAGARGARPIVERLGIPAAPRGGGLAGRLAVGRGRGRRRGRGNANGLQRVVGGQLLQRSASMQSLTGIGRQSRSRSRSRSRLRMDRSLSRGANPNGDLQRGGSRMRMDLPLQRGAVSDWGPSRSRSRSRSRGRPSVQIVPLRRGRSRSRGGSVPQSAILQEGRSRSRTRGDAGIRSRSRGRQQLQPRGGGVGGRGRGQGGRGRGRARSNTRQATRGGPQGGRGRGGLRGRGGRGGPRGRGGRAPPPSKDELDKQLDQYMAKSKGLDQELDSYMKTDNSWA